MGGGNLAAIKDWAGVLDHANSTRKKREHQASITRMSNNCHITSSLRPLFRVVVQSAVLVVSLLLLESPVRAEIIVDDFSKMGDQPFPRQAEYPAFAILGGAETVEGVFAGSRWISAIFGINGPLDPLPADSSISIDLDPALGALIVEAGSDAIIDLSIGWQAALFSPFEDADASIHPKLLIEYSSMIDLDLTVSLANQVRPDFLSTPQTVAGNQKRTFLPAAMNGLFVIDIHEITDPYFNPLLPDVDLTSLDSISLRLRTEQLGSRFSLFRVTLVPEPATGVVFVGLAALFLGWCRSYRIA